MSIKPFLNKFTRVAAILTVGIFIFVLQTGISFAEEVPEQVYYGAENAFAVIGNLHYSDVINSNTWAKEAIYEAGALEILKGFGNRQFGRTNTLSKQEAIAIAYRAAGREADAQMAAEALDNARMQENKKNDAVSMWSDGYLQLAANEGLITRQDLDDAMSAEQESLEAGSFKRSAPAERQEMALWMAKVLGLEPVYGQQEIFNSYNDWKSAEPSNVPYIEAILKGNVMSGDGRGYFNPLKPITREEAAQIVKNADTLILPRLGFSKHTGTIENISTSSDYSDGFGISGRVFAVRNSNGKLHHIITSQSGETHRNEQSGRPLQGVGRELTVHRSGGIGDSSMLKEGDRLEYIIGDDNIVRYVNAVPGTAGMKYIAAQISSIDTGNQLLDVYQFFETGSPNPEELHANISFDMEDENITATYNYSSSLSILVNGKRANISELGTGMNVILSIQNNNVVTAVATADFGINPDEKYIVKGIVEDNNPQLGYITLYNEDGTGNSYQSREHLAVYRTYNYISQNDVEVFKDHKRAVMDDIEAGDTVFIKLDTNGNVVSISGIKNYTVRYGKVLSKGISTFAVEFNDGSQHVLDIDDSVLLIKNSRLSSYSSLKDGDRIKLVLHITNSFTRVKEITIQDDGRSICGLFKGTVSRIDEMSDKVVVFNLEELDRGKWNKSEKKGFTDIKLSDDCAIYYGSMQIDKTSINKYLGSCEAYIAVMQDYGTSKKAVVLSFKNNDDTEVLYDDSIVDSYPGSGRFSLNKAYNRINLNDGSIIVKDDRLVSASSISNEDMAYVVANRDYDSGDYYAGIIEIRERIDNSSIQIYRGRISSINENNDFTVESFSKLEGLSWKYNNTPKTFKLTNSTRIVGESGLINQRNFTDYSEDNYIDTTVYIVTGPDAVNAVMVSNAPYGICNVKGDIYQIEGGIAADNGAVLDEPVVLRLRNVRVYDQAEYKWDDDDNMQIDIMSNSIIIRNNEVIKASSLKKGDSVRIVKRDNSTTGDGYVIFVEN